MITLSKNYWGTLLLATLFFTACDKKKDTPAEETESRYVVMTMSERTPTKPGFVKAFAAFPSGDISTAENSLQGLGRGGWRTYKNNIYTMFLNASNAKGVEKVEVASNGTVSTGNLYFTTNNSINGSGNFVIQDDNTGYFWDADKPWTIQIFNPQTVSKTGEFGTFETQLKNNDAGIGFQGVGQHFLAIKRGKLFADITYSKAGSPQPGMFGTDFFPDVNIAVFDIATKQYEKTITIKNTGSIAYVNENTMYDFDSNGDLYIVCQGINVAGVQSKIARIKAAETTIDATWELTIDEVNEGKGKFLNLYANNGKLIVLLSNVAITNPQQQINNAEIWEYHILDIASKQKTKITGIPAILNPGAANAVVELDNKVYLLGATTTSINGVFELNGTVATQKFNITQGGAITGFYKVNL